MGPIVLAKLAKIHNSRVWGARMRSVSCASRAKPQIALVEWVPTLAGGHSCCLGAGKGAALEVCHRGGEKHDDLVDSCVWLILGVAGDAIEQPKVHYF